MASTVSLPPCTTFNTPFGMPASNASSTKRMVTIGFCSDGFNTKVLPVAIAIGNIQSGIMAGKLNGVIPAQTPSGCWILYISTPVATFSINAPCCRLPMPEACSTTSRPRNTSPLASARVLPCSSVSMAASSSMLSRISCWYFKKMRERVLIGVLRQVLNASAAAATAWLISSGVVWGTLAITCWVAGLLRSIHCSVVDSTNSPLMSCFTVWVVIVTILVFTVLGV